MYIIILILTLICLGQFCPRSKGAIRSTLCEAPNREGQTTTPRTPCPTLYDKCVVSYHLKEIDLLGLKLKEKSNSPE